MEHIKADEHALTESFRFCPAFATFALMVLKLLNEEKPVRGQANINSSATRLERKHQWATETVSS
jgi:hypothetical protein